MARTGGANSRNVDPRCRGVFLDAVELEGGARAAFLDAACAGDQALRRAVEELLEHDRSAGDFLSGDAGGLLEADASAQSGPLGAIGPYALVRVLGEGGFGVVYLAQQHAPVRRTVAVKVLKPGVDTREVVRRFVQERQTLALMDHPGIAKVFDAGSTAAGRPYFVMEYVEGSRITDFCDGARLSLRERVALMIQVCRAVEHAHQKGVIHRDLKPSNILVSLVSGRPTARVIDFGVAKALSEAGGPALTMTGGAERAIGTPDYMSPEQAGAPGGVDTRTDVFALGVVLYELLAGVLPRELPAGDREGWMAEVRQRDAISPSRRLSSLGEQAQVVAQNRATTRALLAKHLRGELGWMPLKAIAREPSRRYGSAGEFAEDLERYLDHRPLRAGPPSRLYLARKFVRRHAVVVGAALAVAASLCAGLLATARENARAEAARAVAESEAARAGRAAEFAEAKRAEAEMQAYVASLTAAAAAIGANDAGGARQALDAAPEALRGWEWSHLRRRTSMQLGELEIPKGIANLDASPDGEWIAEAFADGVRRVRSARSGEARWTAQDPGAAHALAVRVSPDGALMATAEVDLVLRSMADGSIVRRSPAEGGFVCNVAFDPDSRHIYRGDMLGRVRRIDISTGRTLWERRSEGSWIWAIDASPDGREVAWGDNRLVIVADALTGETRRVIPVGSDLEGWRDISDLRYSPDGRTIAASAGVTIQLFDASSGLLIRTLRGHTKPPRRMAFDRSGARLASAGMDRTIRVWDVASGATLSVLRGHQRSVASIAFGCDEERLFSCSIEGLVKTWDAHAGPDVRAFNTALRSNETGRRVGFDRAGSRMLIGTVSTMECWNIPADRIAQIGESVPCRFAAAAISPDGRTIAAGDCDGVVRLIDVGANREVASWRAHDGRMSWLAFSPDGSSLLSASAAGDVAAWTPSGARLALRPTPPGLEAWGLKLSPDGSAVVIARSDARLEIWFWRDGASKLLAPVQGREIICATFTPDGEHVLAASYSGAVHQWNVRSGALVSTTRVSETSLRGIDCSPDGLRVAVGDLDGTVRILDAKDLRQLVALVGHEAWVDHVEWSRDGRFLATADWDGTVRIWER